MTEKTSATPEGAVAEGELTALLGTMPYAVTLGVELEAAAAAETRGHLHWAPERCTIGGALHGGALMSLADAVGAVCAYLNLPPGAAGTTTVESKTNFFRALREGTARAVARPLHGPLLRRRPDRPVRRRGAPPRADHPDAGRAAAPRLIFSNVLSPLVH